VHAAAALEQTTVSRGKHALMSRSSSSSLGLPLSASSCKERYVSESTPWFFLANRRSILVRTDFALPTASASDESLSAAPAACASSSRLSACGMFFR